MQQLLQEAEESKRQLELTNGRLAQNLLDQSRLSQRESDLIDDEHGPRYGSEFQQRWSLRSQKPLRTARYSRDTSPLSKSKKPHSCTPARKTNQTIWSKRNTGNHFHFNAMTGGHRGQYPKKAGSPSEHERENSPKDDNNSFIQSLQTSQNMNNDVESCEYNKFEAPTKSVFVNIEDLSKGKIVDNLNKSDMPFQPAKIGGPNIFQTRPEFSASGREPSPINYRNTARAAPV